MDAPQKTAIVLGATGAVGRRVAYHLLSNPQISRVTVVVRKEQSPEMWLEAEEGGKKKCKPNTKLDIDSDSLKAKLAQLVVPDFDKLDDNAQGWNSHDLGFTCLGMYTGALPEDEWKRREVGYNHQAAKLLQKGGTQRLHYLSGQGSVEGGKSSLSFARVKGETESTLRSVGIPFSSFRPGAVYGRPAELQQYFFEGAMNSLAAHIGTIGGSSCDDIAKAMIYTSLNPNPPPILENAQIKQLSKLYSKEKADD